MLLPLFLFRVLSYYRVCSFSIVFFVLPFLFLYLGIIPFESAVYSFLPLRFVPEIVLFLSLMGRSPHPLFVSKMSISPPERYRVSLDDEVSRVLLAGAAYRRESKNDFSRDTKLKFSRNVEGDI